MKVLKFLPFLLFISGLKTFAIFGDLSTPMSNRASNGYRNIDYEDIDIRAETDFTSFTPLHLASMHAPTEGIRVLIAGGADVHATTKVAKFTPLHLAARAGRIENMKILIENGADVNAKTRQGFTPLHMAAAAHTHSLEAVEFLSSQDGVDINARTDQGYTPLHINIEHHSKAIDFFLQAGADINATAGGHFVNLTPFHVAVSKPHTFRNEAINIQSFIDAGADVHAPVASGDFASFYPLHLAAYTDARENVETLIANKADIEATTHTGHTPLHTTAEQNSYRSAEVLVKAGANLYAKTHKGLTPPKIAKDNPDGYTHLFFKDERKNAEKLNLKSLKIYVKEFLVKNHILLLANTNDNF